MAIVKFPDENRVLDDAKSVGEYLASIGIHYERWEPEHPVAAGRHPRPFSPLNGRTCPFVRWFV